MEEWTASDAETLKRELKKILTEILSYGGGEIKERSESDGSSGVLRAIDEAIRILNCLREVESKMTESDIPSSSSPSPSVEVPEVFKCTLSNTIMIDPVIIASGQTYEKRYITDWLWHKGTCPKTDPDAVLSHFMCTPNHLVDELITSHKYDRIKPADEVVTELSKDGIYSLLKKISSPYSVVDLIQASKELRRQTKKFPNVRQFFLDERPHTIDLLISPLFALDNLWLDAQPDLQENIITTLFNISIVVENKTKIAENKGVIPLLTKSLTRGTLETRRASASTLLTLVVIDSNKSIIGNSETIKALAKVLGKDDLLASLEAASVISHLCPVLEYMEEAISAHVVPVLVRKIKAGNYVDEFLSVLLLFSGHGDAIAEMKMDKDFIKYLFCILRERSCLRSCECAVVIVLNMCNMTKPHANRVMTMVDEEENTYGTFTQLTNEGSGSLVTNADMILQWLKRYGTGKYPLIDYLDIE